MQTERVTFLTSRDHKAALDAFAANRGESVGSVVREATARYISQPPEAKDSSEAALALLLDELEEAMPKWNAKFDSMEASLDHAHEEVLKALATVESTR
jgi:hypothetical protein